MSWLERLGGVGRHPELGHLSAGEQVELIARARGRFRRRQRRHGRAYAAAFLIVAAGAALVLSSEQAMARARAIPAWVPWCVAGAIFAAAMWAGVRSDVGRRLSVRDELLRQDVRPARCFGCGFDLRAADAGVCPECGERIGRKTRLYGRDAPAGARTPDASRERPVL